VNHLPKTGSFNWILLIITLLMGALGVVNLWSASRWAHVDVATTQVIWLGAGLILTLTLAFIDYHLFERWAYTLFLITLMSLLLVLVAGKVVLGARRWISFGFFNIQPAEIMKIALILALAKYFSDDPTPLEKGYTLRHLIKPAIPLYPIGAIGALILFWEKLQVIEVRSFNIPLGHWRLMLLVVCGLWLLFSTWWFLIHGKKRVLRNLVWFASPIYPIMALSALGIGWRWYEAIEVPNFRLELSSFRFVLLGVCLIWTAASVLWILRSGKTSLHDQLSPIVLMVLPIILIVRQPDLGTAVVLFVIAGSLILFMKLRWQSILIATGVLIAAALAAWFLVLQPYQKDRIISFMESNTDSLGRGYHARQSMIAVGSGQATGKGYGESTQTQFKFLPEQNTDFVFPVWAEEWGFLGCVVVLGLFSFWLVLIVNVAAGARDRFGVLIAVGMAAMIFWQVVINIGMVSGILPVVGITLPLWSYGGSSILTIMIGIGLLLSICYRRQAI
jgi:cell division protein FtsW (lipid II flippase)